MKKNKLHNRQLTFFIASLFFMLSYANVESQETYQVDALEIQADQEIEAESSPAIDTNTHNTKLAWMLSAVLPGAGQIYNRKYWKAPIVWGGLAVSVYFFQSNQQKTGLYNNAYFDYIKNTQGIANEQRYKDMTVFQEANVDWDNLTASEASYIQQYLDNNRKSYQRSRDLNVVLIAAVYFLNIVDASVDAHFFDFDVGENLQVQWQPILQTGSLYTSNVGVRFSLNF